MQWGGSRPGPGEYGGLLRTRVDRRQASVASLTLMEAQGREQGLLRTPFPTGGQWRGRQICDRDLPDTADIAKRQWRVENHPRCRRFVVLLLLLLLLGLALLGLAPGAPFC